MNGAGAPQKRLTPNLLTATRAFDIHGPLYIQRCQFGPSANQRCTRPNRTWLYGRRSLPSLVRHVKIKSRICLQLLRARYDAEDITMFLSLIKVHRQYARGTQAASCSFVSVALLESLAFTHIQSKHFLVAFRYM